MTVLVGAPRQALENISITTQRLTTVPCARLAGAGHEVSFPVSSTFWKGFTRGSMSQSGNFSNPCRYGAKYISPEDIHGRYCLGSMIQRKKSLAACGSGPYAKTPCVTGTSAWKRPAGPLGFSPWSITLPMSGRSRLADTMMLYALLVHEIWLVRKALLLCGSSQPMQSSMQASL